MAKNQPAKQAAEATVTTTVQDGEAMVSGELVDGVGAPAAGDTPVIDPEALALAGAATVTAIAPETVQARVLVDGAYGKVNDVVEVPAAEAEASGELDAHPDAVAYALSLSADAEPVAE